MAAGHPAVEPVEERQREFESRYEMVMSHLHQPRFLLTEMAIYKLVSVEGELLEEDLQTLVWALERLCELGVSPLLLESSDFVGFLTSPSFQPVKQRLFQTVCHHFHNIWPRPNNLCLACDFPLLSILLREMTSEMQSQFVKAYEAYLDVSKVDRTLFFFREELLSKRRYRSSPKFQRILHNLCFEHQCRILALGVSDLREVLTLLESCRKVPSLQQASARAVLQALGGDRSKTAGLELTQQALEMLDPSPPSPPVQSPGAFNPFREDASAGDRSPEYMSLLRFLYALPSLYQRLEEEGKNVRTDGVETPPWSGFYGFANWLGRMGERLLRVLRVRD